MALVMLMALTITLIVAMLAVIGLAVRELHLFLRNRESYQLRRLTLRLSMSAMLLFLLGSILVGVRVFHLDTPVGSGNAPLWLVFWGCIGLLTGAILCLVLADFRLIKDEARNGAMQLWREIAEMIASHETNTPKR